jgi:hypothetical protein
MIEPFPGNTPTVSAATPAAMPEISDLFILLLSEQEK